LTKRPEKHNFTSEEVDKFIKKIKPLFNKGPILAEFTENSFPNTLVTTVQYDPKTKDTFIITGDIKAAWLRPSFSIS
jgi:meiotically up-regulated gene 157 (Mug157) protein